jgi:Ca2+-binding EF-hand superfamily protein
MMKVTKGIFKSDARKESNKKFHEIDANKDGAADKDEIATFVAQNHELWAMLSVTLDHSEESCQLAATRVAMELASGLQGDKALQAELSKEQFHKFRKHYVLDPMGSQEFFQRAVFASFDRDNDAVLDEDELERFLETFYKSGSIFKGDIRLPPKEELKGQILDKLDVKKDKRLSFARVRGIISGTAMLDIVEPK